VVISILVLVGAALLGRTLLNLETTDVGFNSSNVLLFQVNMRASGIAAFDDRRLDRYNRTLRERFVALPGVSSASYSIMPLLGGGRLAVISEFRARPRPLRLPKTYFWWDQDFSKRCGYRCWKAERSRKRI